VSVGLSCGHLERGVCLACENKSLRAQAQKAMAERDAAREQGQADYRALHDALVWAHEWHGKELPPPGRPVVAVLAEVARLREALAKCIEALEDAGYFKLAEQCLNALNMTERDQRVEVEPKVLERLLKDVNRLTMERDEALAKMKRWVARADYLGRNVDELARRVEELAREATDRKAQENWMARAEHAEAALAKLQQTREMDLGRAALLERAARAEAARALSVMREHDRKLTEIWGKEESPHACALGWVRVDWNAALADTSALDWLAERLAEARDAALEEAATMTDGSDDVSRRVAADVRALKRGGA